MYTMIDLLNLLLYNLTGIYGVPKGTGEDAPLSPQSATAGV